jgi:hypothetical protein
MIAVAKGKKSPVVLQPLEIVRETPADKWRARLLANAESGKLPVEEAWAKVPEDVKAQLDPGLYEQLVSIAAAGSEHRDSDDAQLDALNDSLSG